MYRHHGVSRKYNPSINHEIRDVESEALWYVGDVEWRDIMLADVWPQQNQLPTETETMDNVKLKMHVCLKHFQLTMCPFIHCHVALKVVCNGKNDLGLYFTLVLVMKIGMCDLMIFCLV